MSRIDWPLVVEHDDGIRPAGPSDECFYCQRKIGQPHGADCVIVTKRIRVRYSFEIEIDVPHHWTESTVLFHRNESTWCADNALNPLQEIADGDGCLCSVFTCDYLGIADDTPRRLVRSDDEPNKPSGPESRAGDAIPLVNSNNLAVEPEGGAP